MGLTDGIKAVNDLLTQLNKVDSNEQQKKMITELRKIKREMEKQRKKSTRDLVVGILAAGYMTIFYDIANRWYEYGFDGWIIGTKALFGLGAVGIGIGVILFLNKKIKN